jgi:hypothetical protein
MVVENRDIGRNVQKRSNQALKLTLDSVLPALPLRSGAFKGSLASRYASMEMP